MFVFVIEVKCKLAFSSGEGGSCSVYGTLVDRGDHHSRKRTAYISLPLEGKVPRNEADEVLQTVFADERLRHRFVGDGAFDVPRKQSVLQNIISVLGTPHPPPAVVPLPPLGKA